MTMTRFKILIEYKGTNYVGWQKQENGKSIQEVIENSIKYLTNEKDRYLEQEELMLVYMHDKCLLILIVIFILKFRI